MTTISILPEPSLLHGAKFRAVSGLRQSFGETAGAALDAISAQLDEQDADTLLVIQKMRPDRFFGETQRNRLALLMDQWRIARDAGIPFHHQVELDQLAAAELAASAQRAAALLNELPQ